MIGDRIKAERKARNWTQADLASRSGINEGYIGLLEQNRRPRPGFDTLSKLAHALDLTVDQLINGPEIDEAFPADQLRKEGLPEAHVIRLSRLWVRFPEKRTALLESAHKLARASAQFEQLAAELREGDENAGEVQPAVHPIAS